MKFICLVLLLFGLPDFSRSQSDPPQRSGPNKLALLIGINRYKYPNAVSTLAGSINDVEDVKALLIGKFDFPAGNILVLENEQATHAAIISAIQNHLIAKAQANDVVVIHFSGHGSQMKDVTGKKINGVDETIVPYDSRDPQSKVFDISGSELHALLRQLSGKTRNITFILDSCHSGTLVRGARVRSAAPDERTPPPLPAYAVGERGLHDVGSEPVPPFALVAAATSKQNAFEHIGGGREHGALTWFLTQQLRIAKSQATWRDVMDIVIANVTANYPAQNPQLEGSQSDQQVFGAPIALARSYVAASPLDRSRITLGQGEVSGMTAGSTFDIYRPGTKQFGPPEKPLATAQVTSVGEFASEARVVSGGPVLQASRAIERIHRYGKTRLRVYLHQKDNSKTLQTLSEALAPMPQIDLVADPAKCQLQLEESGGRILILGADRRTASNPVAVNSSDAVNHLVRQLQLWAKWFNVLAIRSAIAGPDIQVNVRAGQGGSSTTVAEGDKVSVEITNKSARGLYLSILDLSTDGTIDRIYPNVSGASELLEPGRSITRTFDAFIPPGRSFVNDTLKVFASTAPIDLTPLTQERIRDAVPRDADGSDPLNDLLAESAGISRGLRPEGSPSDGASGSSVTPNPAKIADWSATQKLLRIVKK